MKPDVVLYEESLDQDLLSRALRYIAEADMLIIGGTSLNVYPAAGLIQYYSGRKLVLINKGASSELRFPAGEGRHSPAGKRREENFREMRN